MVLSWAKQFQLSSKLEAPHGFISANNTNIGLCVTNPCFQHTLRLPGWQVISALATIAMCFCFRFGPVSAPVPSLVSCSIVFTCLVFSPWLVLTIYTQLCHNLQSLVGHFVQAQDFQDLFSLLIFTSLGFWLWNIPLFTAVWPFTELPSMYSGNDLWLVLNKYHAKHLHSPHITNQKPLTSYTLSLHTTCHSQQWT